MTKHPKQHRTIPPVAVPLLLALCLVCAFCFVRPITANARDSAVITRVREYYPKDAVLPDTEVYYPQISFGENPSQLQTANAMMREYAIGQYVLYRSAVKDGRITVTDETTPVVLTDYKVLRNSGGYLSIQLWNENASLAVPGCFTVRLAERRLLRLADLFTSDTDYCTLLNRALSRQLGTPFDKVRFDTPFCLTEDSLLLVIAGEDQAPEIFEVPLSDLSPQRLRL